MLLMINSNQWLVVTSWLKLCGSVVRNRSCCDHRSLNLICSDQWYWSICVGMFSVSHRVVPLRLRGSDGGSEGEVVLSSVYGGHEEEGQPPQIDSMLDFYLHIVFIKRPAEVRGQQAAHRPLRVLNTGLNPSSSEIRIPKLKINFTIILQTRDRLNPQNKFVFDTSWTFKVDDIIIKTP